MLPHDVEVPQARLLMGSARTSEYEMVNSSEPRNQRVLHLEVHVQSGSTAKAPSVTFDRSGGTSPLLRYHVEVKPRTCLQAGIIGSSLAITPQPFLGSVAPFPYGTSPEPETWESIPRRLVYLSVPPLYDSHRADQVEEQQPPLNAENDISYAGAPFLQHSAPSPMSLGRRLRGCFCLSLLALPPCLVSLYIAAFLSSVRDPGFGLFLVGAIHLVVLVSLFRLVVFEARISQLGRILAADQVEVDGVAEFLRQRSMDDAPVIEFVASENKQIRKRRWIYDHHEDVSPPLEDVLSHAHELSSTYEVVRLRVWVRVALADNKTRGDFMTALHSFYLDALPNSLSVDVLDQDHTIAITRREGGLPRHFRVFRKIFLVSTYLTVSWIPRIVALLFFPHLVDPAFSPFYCHRKRLVSKVTSS